MIEQDYIQPGRYTDDAGHEIVVTGRQTPDGRYEVEYPKMDDRRTILSAATLRRFYAVAGVAAALALLPAAALAASPLSLAKSHAKKDLAALYTQTGNLTPMKLACTGKPAHVTCTATALSLASGTTWKFSEVLKVAGGKVTVVHAPYNPMGA